MKISDPDRNRRRAESIDRYNHSAKRKAAVERYLRKNKHKVKENWLDSREQIKIRIVASGTEAQARLYGCYTAWRKFRKIPPAIRKDILPKPRKSKEKINDLKWQYRKTGGFTAADRYKKNYVSLDKWKRENQKKVWYSSPAISMVTIKSKNKEIPGNPRRKR